MQYEIEAGGRARRVTVNRTGDGFAINVDGRLHQVDAVRIDAYTLSLIVDTDVEARAQGSRIIYNTTLSPAADGSIAVMVGAIPVVVRMNGRRARASRHGGGAAGSGPLRIVAPMPGKIVRILVKVGDTVRARQPIVVVEAMKMENELRADRDGTIAEIHVREGTLVEAGAHLVMIQ